MYIQYIAREGQPVARKEAPPHLLAVSCISVFHPEHASYPVIASARRSRTRFRADLG